MNRVMSAAVSLLLLWNKVRIQDFFGRIDEYDAVWALKPKYLSNINFELSANIVILLNAETVLYRRFRQWRGFGLSKYINLVPMKDCARFAIGTWQLWVRPRVCFVLGKWILPTNVSLEGPYISGKQLKNSHTLLCFLSYHWYLMCILARDSAQIIVLK